MGKHIYSLIKKLPRLSAHLPFPHGLCDRSKNVFQLVGAEKVLCDHHMREIHRIERIRTYLDVGGLQSLLTFTAKSSLSGVASLSAVGDKASMNALGGWRSLRYEELPRNCAGRIV